MSSEHRPQFQKDNITSIKVGRKENKKGGMEGEREGGGGREVGQIGLYVGYKTLKEFVCVSNDKREVHFLKVKVFEEEPIILQNRKKNCRKIIARENLECRNNRLLDEWKRMRRWGGGGRGGEEEEEREKGRGHYRCIFLLYDFMIL